MPPKLEIAKGCSKLWYIRRFNLLKGMSEQEMQRVAAMTRMTRHSRGELIYLPADPSNSIYFLKEGRMKFTGLSEDGDEVLLDIIGPGEIFGEAEAIQETPRTTSAQALDDVLLCEMGRTDFEALLATYPKMSLHVLKLVGFRLKKVEAQLLNLICKDVSTRVREALVNLMDVESISRPNPRVRIGLTQQDLADLIGASRQETSRSLRELEDSGALELKYRHIIVTAPHKLRSEQVC
jgi:CRP/FNR family transcriptional regulator